MKKSDKSPKPAQIRISKSRPGVRRPSPIEEDPEPLSPAFARELDRRVKDSLDRGRYLLVSAFTPRFQLYYNVSEDTYGMNNPKHGTLFKRRRAAALIRGTLRPGIVIVPCRVNRRGELVLSSVKRVEEKRRRSRSGRE